MNKATQEQMDKLIKNAYRQYFNDLMTFAELVVTINLIYRDYTGKELMEHK